MYSSLARSPRLIDRFLEAFIRKASNFAFVVESLFIIQASVSKTSMIGNVNLSQTS